LHRAILKIELQ